MNKPNMFSYHETFPEELPKSIEDALTSFSHMLETPITLFDNNGKIIWEYNTSKKICSMFNLYYSPNSICNKNIVSSSKSASKLGEPYIFVCQGGFIKIAISLIINGDLIGCIMAGPIVMGSIKESLINKILNLNNLSPNAYSKLILFLKDMKTFTPKDVSCLSTLLNNCILSCSSNNNDYLKINKQYKEQSEISKKLQKYKKQNKSLIYPYEMENELIEKVKRGEAKEAQKILKSLLNEISVIESGNFILIKTKIIELCAILSRSILEIVPYTQEVDFDDIALLNDAQNFNELCILTSKLVNNFSISTLDNIYSGDSSVISQAILYIQSNYMNKLSLTDIANILHICPSYLSILFKQEMGVTFTDYINEVRVKKSKELLSDTNLSLLDISIYSGFGDQSYFTKVFKKLEGRTPKQYRKNYKE